MKRFFKVLAIAVVGTFIALVSKSDIPDKYQTILERNPFGLNPPPPPSTETNSAPPPVNVKLTGFGTIGGVKRAYFTVPPKDPKDPQLYLGLSEGERDNALEILSIADQDGEVRVKNSGVEMVLSLKANGFKPATVAPGVAVAPNPPGGAPPQPGASPVYNPAAASSVVAGFNKQAPMPEVPQPQMQQPSGIFPGGAVQPNQNGQPVPANEGIRSIPVPTRTLRLTPQGNNPQSSFHNDAMRDVLMNEAQKQVAANNGGMMPVTVTTPNNPYNSPVVAGNPTPVTHTRYVPMPPLP